MRTKYKALNGLPGPTRRLTAEQTPAAWRETRDDSLEQLKRRVLASSLAGAAEMAEFVALRRAANEAASLAWLTSYPLLVFPALFEEKATEARRQQAFQERVLRRSREFAFSA
jgi:hypothetical protein